jgi:hypothetical protein
MRLRQRQPFSELADCHSTFALHCSPDRPVPSCRPSGSRPDENGSRRPAHVGFHEAFRSTGTREHEHQPRKNQRDARSVTNRLHSDRVAGERMSAMGGKRTLALRSNVPDVADVIDAARRHRAVDLVHRVIEATHRLLGVRLVAEVDQRLVKKEAVPIRVSGGL